MEHLLARLEVDTAPVVRRLMTLLFPSFLPLDKSEQEQIPRCVALIQTNPGATRVFFRNAQHFMDLQQTGEWLGNPKEATLAAMFLLLINYMYKRELVNCLSLSNEIPLLDLI